METNNTPSRANVTAAESIVTTTTPIAAVAESDGVLGTARTRGGSTMTRELRGTDVVRVGPGAGVETTVDQAVRLGYLQRHADGTYGDIDPKDNPDVKRAEAQKAAQEAGPDLSEALEVDEVVSSTLANWSGALKGIGANPVAVVASIVRNPGELPEALAALARQHGVSHAKLHADVQRIAGAVESSMAEYVARDGVKDFASFWSHVQANNAPELVASAMAQVLFMGDARPLREFAKRYVSATAAGVNASPRESVEVVIGGRKMTVGKAFAARNGLIR